MHSNNITIFICTNIRIRTKAETYTFLIFLCFTAASWQGQKGKLTLHYENGFAMNTLKTVDAEKPRLLWYFPYEKLRMSADDGHRLLWLDFGEDGEQVK